MSQLDRAMRVDILARAEMKYASDNPGNAEQDDLAAALVRLSTTSSEALAAVAFHLGLEQSQQDTDKDRS